MTKDKKEQPHSIVNVISDPASAVPKLCTVVNFAVARNKQVIITMLYGESDTSPVLIERVVVDIDHAKKIADVLNKIIKEAEYEHP